MEYNKRILITGYGAVAQALLPMLEKNLHPDWSKVTVIDFNTRHKLLDPWIKRGLRYVRERVTPANLPRLLPAHVADGGLIIDLAWSIDCIEMLHWAHDNNVLYANASIESWDLSGEVHRKPAIERTLYRRYARLLPLQERWRGGVTAVLDHGSNPGIISHFTRQGLLDITRHAARQNALPIARLRKLEQLAAAKDFAGLARLLDVKAIHCSERDTQSTGRARPAGTFISTWSVEGMWEESTSPVEIGWGTHEKWIPQHAIVPETGPRNQIILPQMGLNTWVRSWVPEQEIIGMAVAHGEAFGLSQMLTVPADDAGAQPLYRPTVLYSYLPGDDAFLSLHELRCRNYELQSKRHIVTTEIATGQNTVGALIMGHCFKSWWTGGRLGIGEARKSVAHANATSVQVAAGVLGAVLWAVANPRRGVCLPEDLPHDEILRHARPYLGEVISIPADWAPLAGGRVFFEENLEAPIGQSDPWQFRNFLFSP